jgi:hypothetical protein
MASMRRRAAMHEAGYARRRDYVERAAGQLREEAGPQNADPRAPRPTGRRGETGRYCAT